MKRIHALVISMALCLCAPGSAGVFKMGTDDYLPESCPFLGDGGGRQVITQSGGQYKFILLVDDDGSNGWPPYHDMRPGFAGALANAGYTGHYDIIDVPSDSSGPKADTMSDYHMVIWFTGETWNSNFCVTLTAADEAELAAYLDGGGKLFLCAQDYFYDRYQGYTTFSPGEFPYDYLRVTDTQQDAWGHLETCTARGLTGTVGNGLSAVPCENPYPGHSRIYADTLGTLDGTLAIRMQDPAPQAACALQYDSGTYKLVFTTLSLPAFAQTGHRGTLSGNTVDWFLLSGLVTLQDSVDVAITDSTACKYVQAPALWAIVGLRPEPGSDWNMDLYTDPLFVNFEAQSAVVGDLVDFVVVDYNHSTVGCEGVIFTRSSGAVGATVEYRQGVDEPLEIGIYPTDTTNTRWGAGEVAEIWDVELEAGGYMFTCRVDSGTADLGIALFHNPDTTPYYAGRDAALVLADDNGPGGSETFTVTVPVDDIYGFVVWAKDANQAYYAIELGTTSSDGSVDISPPKSVALGQNLPNPFSRCTIIPYTVQRSRAPNHTVQGKGEGEERGAHQHISLSVYDIGGRLVRVLVDDTKEPGYYTAMWDGTDGRGEQSPSGVYFCQLKADGGSEAGKLLLLR